MIKMKGVLAVPGEYTYGDTVEVKTAEELKDAAFRNPIIPLSYGHTSDGLQPPASMQIGTVSQKWSEEDQKVYGEFWLYEEKIPDSLKDKIDNGEKIPISGGVMLDSVEEGIQKGISYTHFAVLEGENPVCPLDTCGMHVRTESERLVRLEQATDLTPPEETPEKEAEAPLEEPEAVVPDEEPAEEAPEEPKTDPPVEQKPKEADEEPVVEETPLEPETVIPTSTPVVQKPYDVVDGNYVFVPEIFKQKQEKK